MLRQSGKNFVKRQYLLHMFSHYGERRPTCGWDRLAGLGHPSNFNGFRVLASLILHRRCSTEVNQTLHDVWTSPALVHYIYTFWGLFPPTVTEVCQVQNSLCVQVLSSPILAGLLHSTWAVGDSQTAAFSRRRHLYSAGRPSPWASAHILVFWCWFPDCCISAVLASCLYIAAYKDFVFCCILYRTNDMLWILDSKQVVQNRLWPCHYNSVSANLRRLVRLGKQP